MAKAFHEAKFDSLDLARTVVSPASSLRIQTRTEANGCAKESFHQRQAQDPTLHNLDWHSDYHQALSNLRCIGLKPSLPLARG